MTAYLCVFVTRVYCLRGAVSGKRFVAVVQSLLRKNVSDQGSFLGPYVDLDTSPPNGDQKEFGQNALNRLKTAPERWQAWEEIRWLTTLYRANDYDD